MSQFPIEKLGKYVYEVREPVGDISGNNLPVYGVTNVGGITITGKKTSDDLSKYITLKPNYFAYNPYRINVGSIGLASKEQDGIVSPAYVVFTTKQELDPNYLFLYLKSVEGHQQINFFGNRGSVRKALRFKDLCKIEIPLPPLSEQQLIISKLEVLSSKIEEAKKIKEQALMEIEIVFDSVLYDLIKRGVKIGWNLVPFENVCIINPSKKNLNYPDELLVSFVPMTAVDDVTGTIYKRVIKPYCEVKNGYNWFIEGDVIFARITPCMENGKSAIARNLENGVGFGSTEFHVLRPKENVLPEWIHYYIRSKRFRKLAEESFKGTAGQQRVQEGFFYKQKIPLPPIGIQRDFVKYLDELQEKILNLGAEQLEVQSELNALEKSILSKAFKGEL